MMTTLKTAVVVAIIACLPARSVTAEDLTPEKQAAIATLLDMTGALAIGKQMSRAIIAESTQALKRKNPSIPQKALDLLEEEVNAVIDEEMPALKDQFAPLYHKYFTHAEIKDMIQFYSTETGKKTVQVMPVLIQEAMTMGRQWGLSLGPKISQRLRERLKAEGIDI
jgi:uncharacterized protein